MQSDRELEEMIDAAIPGYSRVKPPLGLEQRILARSLAENPRRRFAWQWSLAIPAITCLLIVILLVGLRKRAPQELQSTIKNVPTLAAPTVVAIPPHRHTTQPHPRPLPSQAARTPNVLPKQETFPSPTPPTAEEEAMIALTRAQARIGSEPAEAEVEIPEVRIAELEIEPAPTLADLKLGPSAAPSSPTSQQP